MRGMVDNLKIVDYLGVTLNLNDGTYCPFHKPNKETTYIHVESDHPLQIKVPLKIVNMFCMKLWVPTYQN